MRTDKEIDELEHHLKGVKAFALYRMPWTDELCLIEQHTGDVTELLSIDALSGKRGFVIAPFCSSQHPLVLIHPDKIACGWGEISQLLVHTCYASSCPTSSIDAVQSSTQERLVYQHAFQRFINPLREGRFQKLVLSRAITQSLPTSFSSLKAFLNACNCYPRMMVYLCYTPVTGMWMGSTPEILLSGKGQNWHTVALAGTMAVNDSVIPAIWSTKNQEEQAYVATYIRQLIEKYGDELTEEGPYTTRAGQLFHLKTDFRFLLQDISLLGMLLRDLHPTPAVCGLPKQEAWQFITEQEGYDRKYYSGFIGPLNIHGQTDLFVNLRCMEIASQYVRLYAGGGILAQSDLESEWQETSEKMQTMRRIIDDINWFYRV